MVRVGLKVQFVIICFVLFDFFLMLYNVENCVGGRRERVIDGGAAYLTRTFNFCVAIVSAYVSFNSLRFGAVNVWSSKLFDQILPS